MIWTTAPARSTVQSAGHRTIISSITKCGNAEPYPGNTINRGQSRKQQLEYLRRRPTVADVDTQTGAALAGLTGEIGGRTPALQKPEFYGCAAESIAPACLPPLVCRTRTTEFFVRFFPECRRNAKVVAFMSLTAHESQFN